MDSWHIGLNSSALCERNDGGTCDMTHLGKTDLKFRREKKTEGRKKLFKKKLAHVVLSLRNSVFYEFLYFLFLLFFQCTKENYPRHCLLLKLNCFEEAVNYLRNPRKRINTVIPHFLKNYFRNEKRKKKIRSKRFCLKWSWR